jgi:hypothetical protein
VIQIVAYSVALVDRFTASFEWASRSLRPPSGGPFVYCIAKITQLEQKGEEEGHLTYLWLLVLVFVFMCMGYMFWGYIR